jgi:hypothetical protein
MTAVFGPQNLPTVPQNMPSRGIDSYARVSVAMYNSTGGNVTVHFIYPGGEDRPQMLASGGVDLLRDAELAQIWASVTGVNAYIAIEPEWRDPHYLVTISGTTLTDFGQSSVPATLAKDTTVSTVNTTLGGSAGNLVVKTITNNVPTDIGSTGTYAKTTDISTVNTTLGGSAGNLVLKSVTNNVPTDIGSTGTYAKTSDISTVNATLGGSAGNLVLKSITNNVGTDIGSAGTYSKDATLTGGNLLEKNSATISSSLTTIHGQFPSALTGGGNLKVDLLAQTVGNLATDIGATNTYAKHADITTLQGQLPTSLSGAGNLKADITAQTLATLTTDVGNSNLYSKDATLTNGNLKVGLAGKSLPSGGQAPADGYVVIWGVGTASEPMLSGTKFGAGSILTGAGYVSPKIPVASGDVLTVSNITLTKMVWTPTG